MPSTACAVRFMRSISLVMARRMATLRTAAMTTMSRMRRPIPSQVDQFCSTQLAALVACSWASLNVVGSEDGSDADRTDKITAETSRHSGRP